MTDTTLAPFVERLLEIFETEKHSESVEWNDNQIYIKDVFQFTKNVIPNYFKVQKMESFMRQLNLYGFSRVGNSKRLVFKNENFRRGDIEKLRLIQIKEKVRDQMEGKSKEQAQKMMLDSVLQKNKDVFQKCLSGLFSKMSEFMKTNPGSESDFKTSMALLQMTMYEPESSGQKSPISDYSHKTAACDQ